MVCVVRYEEGPVERRCGYCRVLDGSGGRCDGGSRSRVGSLKKREKEQGDGYAVGCVRGGKAVLVMMRSDGSNWCQSKQDRLKTGLTQSGHGGREWPGRADGVLDERGDIHSQR